jgi:hypothetical protein
MRDGRRMSTDDDMRAALQEIMSDLKKGWTGQFSTHQYPGAYPNGARIEKLLMEEGDAHAPGAKGTVLGSIGHPTIGVAYFVEWDDMPKLAVLVVATKIREAK